jgi:calpain-7
LPTLQRTFTLYIASAESYSHLLSSGLVPAHEKEAIRKKWRLVLERAEKVKKRIEGLGGQVAKIDPGDEGTENAVVRRGGLMNGCKLDLWHEPSPREFEGSEYREVKEPDMPDVDVVWKDIGKEEWACDVGREDVWTVRQGTGADCSVAAGLGVSLEHNRLWDSKVRLHRLS